ncbi:MAG: glycosyltransferase family 9 protein [Candidatus Methylomirabilota bacterium]
MSGGSLVVRGGAIGDFILTLPVLAALRRTFPGRRLTVLGRPGVAELARAGGLADQLWSIEARGLAGFLVEEGACDPDLAALFAGQSLIVSYLFDPDGTFHRNLRRCTAARIVAGPHRPDEFSGVHASEALLAPLAALGIVDADPVPRLAIPQDPGRSPAAASPTLAVHPGSGSPRKNWPEARWAEILRRLATASALRVLLVGGEAEAGRAARLAAALPPERVEVAEGLPLVELAGRLARCRGFVGHDSGITHLAAALGLPCLALWGESRADVWRPRGARALIFRDPAGLSNLPVERVMEAVGSWGREAGIPL